MSFKAIIKTLIIQIIIIAIIIIGTLFYLDAYTNHGEGISVKDLKGMSVDKAESVLADNGLKLEVIDTIDFNPKIPPLSVSWQEPVPKELIKKGRTIYAKVNPAAFAYVRLPKVENRSLTYAKRKITELGLKLGKTIYEPDFNKNTVLRIEQNNRILRKGDKLQKNSTVNLILGDGSLGVIKRQRYERDAYEDAAPKIDSIY